MRIKVLRSTIFLVILFAVIFAYIEFHNEEKKNFGIQVEKYKTICGEYKKGEIKIGSEILLVDIADDNCKKNLGLSGKASLNNEGMFFVFEKEENYGFWMKDMNFPIDILWIDDDFEIIGIEKSVLPSTYPNLFGSEYLARYVLEVSAGYSDGNNIKVGDKIIFYEK